MKNKGQSALEYLMTYGWALIVVAVVVGILILVTSSTGAGVTCTSSNTSIVLKGQTFAIGADKVEFALANATGGTVTLLADCITAASGSISEGATASACLPSSVTAGTNFTVKQLDGPSSSGNVDGTASVSYTTAEGLAGTANITCKGKV